MIARCVLIFIFLSSFVPLYGQGFLNANSWKKFRKEYIIQIGVSGFLGDLGGRDRIGTDFSPVDFDIQAKKMAVSLAYRYKFIPNIGLHTSFNYLGITGNDNLTQERFRNNRNLNFKSNIFELAARLELGTHNLKSRGIYSIKKSLRRYRKSLKTELIGFAGIGVFYFNPKGLDPNTGKYISLWNLHTEGQGLANGPRQYKKIAVSIPVGLLFHMTLKKLWSVGLELNYRFTLSDYLDDVSGVYYSREDLALAYGTKSVQMADPNKGLISGQTLPNADGTGAQRGDNNKDSFMSLQLTIGKAFKKTRRKTKLRTKF